MAHRILVTVLIASGVTAQDDIIHYKFEMGDGYRVINYAADPPAGTEFGVLEFNESFVTLADAWGTGRYGGGLGASAILGAEVNTGWSNEVPEDVTIACFFKIARPVPLSETFKMAGFDGAGLAQVGPRLWFRRGNGSQLDSVRFEWRDNQGSGHEVVPLTGSDLYAQALAGWVHVAVNVDHSSGISRWFWNGAFAGADVLSSSINPPLSGTSHGYRIGDRDGFAIFDEFRISTRTVVTPEITTWALEQSAVAARYGERCHPFGLPFVLDGTQGGLPSLGNAAHELTVFGLPQATVGLIVGTSGVSIGGLPLPLDLGVVFPELAGCELGASNDIASFGATIAPNGSASFPLAVPSDPSFTGFPFYAQAITYSAILQRASLTEVWAGIVGT